DGHVAAFDVPQFAQPLPEGIDKVSACGHGVRPENPDAGKSRRLLRARRERPGSRCAEQGDELAAFHSITSSARASSVGGGSRPSAVAVVRLITRSNLVGCSTGMSAGFAPRKILSTNSPARRNRSV